MWGEGTRRKGESWIRARLGENRLGREGEPGWPSSDQHKQSHHGKLAPGLERMPRILTQYYTDADRHAVKPWQRTDPTLSDVSRGAQVTGTPTSKASLSWVAFWWGYFSPLLFGGKW